MSNTITPRRPTLNIPLLVLWVAAAGVASFGTWMLIAGNAAQAEFYTSQGSDYLEFLNLQTQSTIGGMLIITGIAGVFLALATHARNRAAAAPAAGVAEAGTEVDDTETDGADTVDDADTIDELESDAEIEADSTDDVDAEPAPAEPARA